jgi:cytoskeletal protein RodZ
MADRPTYRPQPHPARAQARRDAGLQKISRLTGLALAGSLALTGVLSEVAAQARPGHARTQAKTHADATARQSASTSSSSSSSGTSQAQAPSDDGSSTLQPPVETPAPSSGVGGSVSGGS